MEKQQDLQSFFVVWRGQKLIVEINPGATLKDLGDKLQELTHVEADTLRLLVPMEKSSKLLYPFSDEHSHMSLESASVLKVQKPLMCSIFRCTLELDDMLFRMILTYCSFFKSVRGNAYLLYMRRSEGSLVHDFFQNQPLI